ncbi:MAG: ATP synthase F1 subunit delta [Bacteroidales bacterium]|jgi:F-type H+-transporting ATPase subunit delta|nr:ATP synthase F1 subunit delta [Bacteroidales bacterium]
MNQSIVSTRYAKALMMVGAENQCLDALKADMELLGDTIKGNLVFRQMMDNPVIKPPQKRKVMAELFEKRVHPMTLNFINIIIRNRRELLLADVARDFIDLYEKFKGIKRAHLVSAAGMDDRSQQQLQQQLNMLFKADVQITAEINPDLIGGFVLRVGDQQYDASLSSGLERIRKSLKSYRSIKVKL